MAWKVKLAKMITGLLVYPNQRGTLGGAKRGGIGNFLVRSLDEASHLPSQYVGLTDGEIRGVERDLSTNKLITGFNLNDLALELIIYEAEHLS